MVVSSKALFTKDSSFDWLRKKDSFKSLCSFEKFQFSKLLSTALGASGALKPSPKISDKFGYNLACLALPN